MSKKLTEGEWSETLKAIISDENKRKEVIKEL